MSHWHVVVWIRIWDISVVLLYYLCSCGELRLLISWCVGDRYDMADSDEDLGRSRIPGADDRDGQIQADHSMVRWSGGRVTSCVIYTVHKEIKSASLDLKTDSSGLVIWGSKSSRRFLGLSLKTKRASVYQLRHKTDRGRSARNTHRDLMSYFVWKQVRLGFLSLASRPADAQWQVVQVASSRRLRRVEAEDSRVITMGYDRPFYH
jgi:hypothetical protein